MKYIDADRLRKAVEEKYNSNGGVDDIWGFGYDTACEQILEIIDSLQQEQPEQPTRGYDEAYLNEKIAKATKSWKGVDVDKFMDEMRGREPEVDLEEAAENIYKTPFGTRAEDFIAGAEWMQDQFEKNRLSHCDKLTKEEYDRETDFATEIIEKEHRQPTFTDAINYGMRVMKDQMMKEAAEGVVEDWNPESHPEITIPLNPEEFTAGDKVKLIVVKED